MRSSYRFGYGDLFECLIAIFYGTVVGEAGFLSIWAVFGTRPWFVRWPLTLVVGELLLLAIFCGIVVGESRVPPGNDVWFPFFCVPIVLVAAQTPLWGLRFFVNYRIVRRDAPAAQAGPLEGRIGIAHLMAAIMIVAIAMGMARTGLLNVAAGQGEYRRSRMGRSHFVLRLCSPLECLCHASVPLGGIDCEAEGSGSGGHCGVRGCDVPDRYRSCNGVHTPRPEHGLHSLRLCPFCQRYRGDIAARGPARAPPQRIRAGPHTAQAWRAAPDAGAAAGSPAVRRR